MSGLLVRNLRRDGLQPVDLRVEAGRTLCIHGRSGSGKSLLLRALADLDPNSGNVSLDGTERQALSGPAWRARLIYVPPESHWWAETVGEHARDWSTALLQQLGFEPDVMDWVVGRLSSGERQRLAIARALSRAPQALLLDEPTANLDPANALAAETAIKAYQAEHQAPLLWVSHDPRQRDRVADLCREMIDGRLLGDVGHG